MDTQRLILLLIFSFSGFMLWQAWERDHRPPVPTSAPVAAEKSAEPARALPAEGATSLPGTAVPGAAVLGATERAPAKSQLIAIRTDRYTAEIDTLGGEIASIALEQHRDAQDLGKPYYVLMRTAARTEVAQFGLLGGSVAGLSGGGLPNSKTLYEALPGPRELAAGADRLELRMTAKSAAGDPVTLVMTFHRDSYVIDVAYTITNAGAAPIAPDAYFQLLRDTKTAVQQSSWAPVAYVGPVLYNETDKFKKLDFGELDKLAADSHRKLPYTRNTDNGWVGMIEHYFVTAWLPGDEKRTAREFYAQRVDGGLYRVGVILPVGAIAPGATGEIRVPLYAGPQEQEALAALAKGLDLVVDYGIFTVIAAPLFWLVKWLHSLLHNWGWAIIAMTILIKTAFYPLNHASARSMAKMKVIGPKLKALQEQYKDDKQQLQARMMEMYKQEKINPLGGCLPIVVQIPVFLALYWVLLSAVELRHAPWIGWIQDLSAPDPWYVLPVIYAITAYLQVRLSPTPISDPVQAKVMQIMPIAFSVMFVFFPSGLVLYWLINNCIQIFQQWHMNRLLEKEAAVAAAKRR